MFSKDKVRSRLKVFENDGPVAVVGSNLTQMDDDNSPHRILFVHGPGTGGGELVDSIRHANPGLAIHECASPLSAQDVAEAERAQFVHGAILWPDVERYFSGWRKFTLLCEPTARWRAAGWPEKANGPDGEIGDSYAHQFANTTGEALDGRSLVEAAKANLAALDFILIAGKLSVDLPLLCARLGLNAPVQNLTGDVASSSFHPPDGQALCDEMVEICESVQKAGGDDREIYYHPLDTRLGAPFVRRSVRPLIAFVTPIFPQEYGVPVYSLLIAKSLYRNARIDLINPEPPPRADSLYFNSHIDTDAHLDLRGYDNRLFVFGNHSALHGSAIALAQDSSAGVCIYHDAQMLDQTVHILGLERTRRLAEKELGRPVASEEIPQWFRDRSKLPCPLQTPVGNGRFIDVVHSPIQKVVHNAFYPCSEAVYIPHAIQHVTVSDQFSPVGRMMARAIVGMPAEQLAIASCGGVNVAKRLDDVVFALRHLHDWQVKAHLYFVGTISDDADGRLFDVAGRLGLQDFIHFTGRVTEERYIQYLCAADAGVQLRLGLFGQLSGAVIDCIAAGLPTVTPRSLGAALEAPSFVTRIPDIYSSLDVAHALETALVSGRSAVAGDEWQAYVEEHSFDRYVKRLGYLLGI